MSSKKVVNLYPGGGRTKLDDIIRLYLAWGKNFIILLDGDQGGVESQKEYIKKYGPVLNNKVFTLKDIFNLDLETEDLIEETDQRAIYDSVYGEDSFNQTKKSKPTAIKSNLNFVINQLQFEKRKAQFSTKTKNNFEKVYKFVVDALKK